MLLAIDAGNTNVVFGLFGSQTDAPLTIWRMASRRDRTADEWFSLLVPLLASRSETPASLTGAIVSSVVPSISDSLVQAMETRFDVTPLVVSVDLDLGIVVGTDLPRETGTDRIVNCTEAFARFGGPTIVVDLGTATKIEAITESGVFQGGTIAPGLGLSLDALATRAARLYAVQLKRTSSVIGSNTITAVQAGIVEGHLAMIEGIVARMTSRLGEVRHIVLTGGYASVFAEVVSDSVFTDFEPDLTLAGLRRIYQRNHR
jgi:type III pantothenate kinase